MNILKKIKFKLINFSYYLSNNCFLPFRNLEDDHFNKKIIVYSLVWGSHFESYFNYTLPSLLHESNYKKLINANFSLIFVIYTIDSESFIREKYKDLIDKNKHIELEIVELKNLQSNKPRKIASKAIIDVFKRCVNESSMLFLAPPDTIFGNGSIYNSIFFSFDKKKSFASAHPRVKYDMLESIRPFSREGISNSELVYLVMKHPHDNFKYADYSLDLNTADAGISYTKISDLLYSVISIMPTTYLVFPLKEDYEYFKKVNDFNMWDRGWLEILIKENRLNICGSSDLFFCAELTGDSDEEKQSLLNQKTNISNQMTIHSRVCSMFTSIWRAKEI
jgi:hypothetical protein